MLTSPLRAYLVSATTLLKHPIPLPAPDAFGRFGDVAAGELQVIVTEAEVTDWLDMYFEAWYAADAARASALFAIDAVYVVTPYEKPWPDGERMSGRDQIAESGSG